MKIILVFGLGMFAVVAAIVIWQGSVQRWIESDRLEANSYEAVQRIKQLESHLAMTESEERDYAVTALTKDVRTLRQLTDEGAQQRAEWENLEKLLSQRLAQLRGQVASNKEITDQLRTLLRSLGNEETNRLHQRIEQKQKQMFSTVQEITVLLTCGTVLFLWVFSLLRREIFARRAAEIQIRKEHDALEQALRDLEQSHWHLDKVAEYLPICMQCGKVKTADARWETIIDYFRKNNLLFTHGLCPECDAKVRKDFVEKRNGSKPA